MSTEALRSPLATAAGEEVVSLVTGCLRVGKTAGGSKLRQHLQLLDQLVVELAAALVGLQRLVAVGRFVKRNGAPGAQPQASKSLNSGLRSITSRTNQHWGSTFRLRR